MKFERKELDDGGVEYKVIGELKSYFLNEINNALSIDVENEKAKYFSFDFQEVSYIDSQGIRLLVMAGKYNYSRELRLTIHGANDNVRRILGLAEIRFIDLVD